MINRRNRSIIVKRTFHFHTRILLSLVSIETSIIRNQHYYDGTILKHQILVEYWSEQATCHTRYLISIRNPGKYRKHRSG